MDGQGFDPVGLFEASRSGGSRVPPGFWDDDDNCRAVLLGLWQHHKVSDPLVLTTAWYHRHGIGTVLVRRFGGSPGRMLAILFPQRFQATESPGKRVRRTKKISVRRPRGTWTREAFVAELRRWTDAGNQIHSRAMLRGNSPLYYAGRELYDSWAKAVAAAGIEYEEVKRIPVSKGAQLVGELTAQHLNQLEAAAREKGATIGSCVLEAITEWLRLYQPS